jgi:hypothetical protein
MSGKRKKDMKDPKTTTKDPKRTRVETTVGELIAALCEEVLPFLGKEEESIVVAYILNDLLRRQDPIGDGGRRRRCRREKIGANGRQSKRN